MESVRFIFEIPPDTHFLDGSMFSSLGWCLLGVPCRRGRSIEPPRRPVGVAFLSLLGVTLSFSLFERQLLFPKHMAHGLI